MKESIFRKKSLERISSPEQIDDYMKVTSPGMWLVLCVIFLLLSAGIFWSITAKIEENIVEDGQIVTREVAPVSFIIP